MNTITKSPNLSYFPTPAQRKDWDPLRPIRRWINSITVKNSRFAHFVCQLIPCECPFERDVVLLGRKLFHIPPLCKLNPFYNEIVGLRFRALTYLSDVCEVDVTQYIC
ncbi:MAG: Mo-dependent nitrogenase C-terminal domain-containing protein [Pseudanabaenales cyanobacterium]|nr:Mo-dependent nitrogenase C-terminal domain-containing protein [Pseudanabaenales cyanobacterium]